MPPTTSKLPAGNAVLHTGVRGGLRRHLADPHLPGDSLRQRSVHLRLQLETLGRAPIATAPEILKYLTESIRENGLGDYIRYRHKVRTASWSSEAQRWQLQVNNLRAASSWRLPRASCGCARVTMTTTSRTPKWPGMDRYQGEGRAPQPWPEDLDYSDMKVLVTGSGATAATLVPAMAGKCRHITMLQRSPTYFYPRPNTDELAEMLRPLDIPNEWTTRLSGRKSCWTRKNSCAALQRSQAVKAELLAAAGSCSEDNLTSTGISRPATAPGNSGSRSFRTAICLRAYAGAWPAW